MFCAAFVASDCLRSCFSLRRSGLLSSETWLTPDGVLDSREHRTVPGAGTSVSLAATLALTAEVAVIVAEAEIDLRV
jgi:hypothetical protein